MERGWSVSFQSKNKNKNKREIIKWKFFGENFLGNVKTIPKCIWKYTCMLYYVEYSAKCNECGCTIWRYGEWDEAFSHNSIMYTMFAYLFKIRRTMLPWKKFIIKRIPIYAVCQYHNDWGKTVYVTCKNYCLSSFDFHVARKNQTAHRWNVFLISILLPITVISVSPFIFFQLFHLVCEASIFLSFTGASPFDSLILIQCSTPITRSFLLGLPYNQKFVRLQICMRIRNLNSQIFASCAIRK